MTARTPVKGRSSRPRLVGVISRPADLPAALRLRRPPDFFELRLDALLPLLPETARYAGKLGAPLIITARHPLEAGMNNLSPGRRAELLLRFLPLASYVDVELRAVAELRPVLEAAANRRLQRIISVHDFHRTPEVERMGEMLRAARRAAADIFKIVTRTESEEDVERLVEFFETHKRAHPISAMGTGKQGRAARLLLARRGSVLNYVHLGGQQIEGQLSLLEFRRLMTA